MKHSYVQENALKLTTFFKTVMLQLKKILCNRIKFFLSTHESLLCSHIVCVEEIPLFPLRLVTVNLNKHCWVYFYVTLDIGYNGRLLWCWWLIYKCHKIGRWKDCHPLQAIINIFGSTTNSKEQSNFLKLMGTRVIPTKDGLSVNFN